MPDTRSGHSSVSTAIRAGLLGAVAREAGNIAIDSSVAAGAAAINLAKKASSALRSSKPYKHPGFENYSGRQGKYQPSTFRSKAFGAYHGPRKRAKSSYRPRRKRYGPKRRPRYRRNSYRRSYRRRY